MRNYRLDAHPVAHYDIPFYTQGGKRRQPTTINGST